MSALTAFTTLLVQFFEDMSETYPEEADIKSACTALKALKRLNPKLIHTTFMNTVYTEFKEPIMRKDEEYLVKRAHEILEKDYSEMAYAFWIFDKHWKTMSDTNKNHVWNYCEKLIKIAELVK